MTDWAITLSFDHLKPTPEAAIAIEEQLGPDLDACVSFVPSPGWCNVVVHAAAVSPFGALDVARRAVAAVIDREPIAVEVVTDAEVARRVEVPNWLSDTAANLN